jgi:uncharacterized protein (TIGR00255 family)
MYLRSMTGFARVEGANQDPKKPLAWVWEIKSVNGRNLDIRFRLPSPYDAVEQALRTRLNQAMKRGNVSVTLALKDDGKSDLLIDNEMLQKILNLQKELGQQVEQSRPKITELLSVPGMFRNPKAVEAAVDPNVEKQLLSSFDQCVMAFNNAREKEGKQIGEAEIGGVQNNIGLLLQRREQAAFLLNAVAHRPVYRQRMAAAGFGEAVD